VVLGIRYTKYDYLYQTVSFLKQLVRDLEKDLFEKLESGPKHISDLVLVLHCNKKNLLHIIDKQRDKQLQIDKIGNKKIISLTPHNLEQEHELLVGSMKLFKETLDKYYIPKLKKMKPIFKNIKRFESGGIQYWVNPKARKDLDNISSLMDQIMHFSFNLTYNDVLDLIPKKFRTQFKEDQKLCVETMEYHLDQFEKLAGKNNEDVAKSYLFNKKRILHKLKA
jgi:hypothetical protein